MGSIHERLQNLQEAREIDRQAKEAEEKAFNDRRTELQRAEDDVPTARREQFQKFQVLRELGIMDMIEDATGGLKVDMEYPLSREEIEERRRARKEEVANMIREFDSKRPMRGKKPALPVDLPRLSPSVFRYNDAGWRSEISAPCVTKDFEWDTTLRIRVIKQELKSSRHDGPRYPTDDRQVEIAFDGERLKIAGEKPVFNDWIPANEELRQSLLEEAFVQAFDNMKDISNKRAPDSYNYPRDLIGLES